MLGSPFFRPSEGPSSPSAAPCQSCSAWTLFLPFPLFNQTPRGCREQWGPTQTLWHHSPPSLPVNYPRGPLKPFFTLAPPATPWSRLLCLGLSSLHAFQNICQKNHEVQRTARVMLRSPQAHLHQTHFLPREAQDPLLWMDLQNLLQVCVSFSGQRPALGCSASPFSGLKAMSVETR